MDQNGIKCEAVKDFSCLKEEWTRLFLTSGCSPFMSWEWMSTWYKHFCGPNEPVVITASRGKEIIGILPMVLQKSSQFGIRTTAIKMAGEGPGGADHLDAICQPSDRVDTVSSILKFISEDMQVDTIALSNLAETSPAVVVAEELSRATASVLPRYSRKVASVCPQIDLSLGWEMVLSNSKRRSNFKRRLKSLEKLPDLEYRSITALNDISGAFERFLDLHERRWAASGGSELSGHPRLIAFQRELVTRLAAAGLVRFEELWANGACRSSVYCVENRETLYYFNSGYDEEYADKSVGLVLLGLSIKNAISRSVQVYDFLRGDETYKFDWTNRTAEVLDVALRRDSFLGDVADRIDELVCVLKRVGRSTLPEGFATSLANRRRALKRSYQMSGN